MARLIVKSPYIKCGGGNSAGGYMRYIATRDRVELIQDDRSPTRKQEQLIVKLVKDFPDAREMDVSTSTTLNIYAHVTDEMRRTAAVKIDRGISKTELQKTTDSAVPRKPAPSTFQPYKGQRRKPGTGCVSQVNDKLWEGRFSPIWPDGKKHPRNVYAHSKEECERLLAEMIQQVKAEIAAEKERLNLRKKAG